MIDDLYITAGTVHFWKKMVKKKVIIERFMRNCKFLPIISCCGPWPVNQIYWTVLHLLQCKEQYLTMEIMWKNRSKRLMVLLTDFVKWSILGNSLICFCAGSGSAFQRTPQDRGRAAAANTTSVILFSFFIMMSFITNCCLQCPLFMVHFQNEAIVAILSSCGHVMTLT